MRLLRQVGNECDTRTLDDPWFPTLPTYKIWSPKPHNSPLVLIKDLRQDNKWNDSVLRALFSQAKISAIKNTPIREVPCPNR